MSIEAMKQALEAWESANLDEVSKAMVALHQAIEQAEKQEPVAWSVLDKRTGKHWYTHESKYTAQYYANEYGHQDADGFSMIVKPLYTAPPRKEWVGLTDDETTLVIHEWRHQEGKPYQLCKAIEAKLKERNT